MFHRELTMFVNIQYIFILALMCTSCKGSERDIWPGYSYHPELNGWLKLHAELESWRAARVSCHMEGAFLASAWTTKFAMSVHRLQSGGDQSSKSPLPAMYSGFHTTSAEGAFTIVNSKATISLDLKRLATLERCGAFFINGTSGEVSCDSLLPFVCYVPAPAPKATTVFSTAVPIYTTPASVCEPCNACEQCTACKSCYAYEDCVKSNEYEFRIRTGRWYKFHWYAQYWHDSKRVCESEYGQLAVINSKAEAETLVNLYENYKHMILNAEADFWIGIGIFNDGSGLKTIQNQTVEDAGYAAWLDNHPLSGIVYGYMTSDGRLVTSVDKNLAFICERII